MSKLSPYFYLHLPEISVFYAVSFLVLGIVVFLQPREDEILHFSPYLWLVSVFGLLHGFKELLDWWALGEPALGNTFQGFNTYALLFSYLPLFEFGRRIMSTEAAGLSGKVPLGQAGLPRWIYIVVALGIFVIAQSTANGYAGFSAGIRLVMGVPAALLTGVGFYLYARHNRSLLHQMRAYWSLHAAAGGFVVYGLSTGVVSSVNANAPWFLVTQDSFVHWFGVPVQLIRAMCAAVIMLGLALLLRQTNKESSRRGQRANESVIALNKQLEVRVQQRTQQLEETNRLLQQENAERKQAQAALLSSEENLQKAQTIANMGSWYLNIPNDVLWWSEQTYRIFAVPKDIALSYESFLGFIHPEDRQAVDAAWQQALKGKPYDIEHRILVQGQVKWVREQVELEFDVHGQLRAGVGTVQDITERKQAYAALEQALANLQQSEQQQRELRALSQREQGRMAALLSAMSIGILFEDRRGIIEYVNPSFRSMWAIRETEELVGKDTQFVLENSTHRFARPDHASKFVLKVLDTHEISERFEVDLCDGRILTQISYPVLDPEERLLGRLWIYEDITNERQTAEQLLYLAERDPLTGLYNRNRFQDQLEQSIVRARRSKSKFALLYFDLDEFKYINDTFGHRAGDSVLVRTANEVYGLVRAGEMLARLGGDEFALLVMLPNDDNVGAIANRVVKAVSVLPFRFRGRNLRLTTSVGVAVFPEHGDNSEELVAHADAAMYQAKGQGKNTWTIYDPSRDASEAMVERLSWNQRILQALEQNLLELHFQGVYSTSTRSLQHLEALIRMRDVGHPEQLIMPGQFIPIAEKSGAIVELDRWVIARGIEFLAAHAELPALAVNISGRTFDEPALPHYIRELLAKHNVSAKRLIVELTETAAVSDIQDAQRFIEALHKMGCQVCLDDFGSGFATFTYLKHLGVELLKIDGQFIGDLPNHPDNQAFVKAMMDVARGLKKKCIAEFVEDGPTLDMLNDIGVEFAQGYYLDRPSANHAAFTFAPAN